MSEDSHRVPTSLLARVLLGSGLLGLIASFALAIEKYLLMSDPLHVPSCNVGARVSCTSVMNSDQAAVLGFPNAFLGIAGFAVVAATGAMLVGGGRLARWYAAGLQVGALAGVVSSVWLIVESLVVIHSLCPYCMLAWAATLVFAWYVTLHNLGRLRHRLPTRAERMLTIAEQNHSAIAAGMLLLLALTVVLGALRFTG